MKRSMSRDEREAQAALQNALEARSDRLRAGWLSIAQDWFALLAKKQFPAKQDNAAAPEKKSAP
jgi:hypothetical protein